MKTKPQVKTAKAAKVVKAVKAATPESAPEPAAQELDIEPWKVVTLQSKPKSHGGKLVITITSKLQYRGRTLVSSQGASAQITLQALANQYNASGHTPRLHKKAYADMSEAARAATAMKRCNQDNIMQPFVG